jgi:hypothetical protein
MGERRCQSDALQLTYDACAGAVGVIWVETSSNQRIGGHDPSCRSIVHEATTDEAYKLFCDTR